MAMYGQVAILLETFLFIILWYYALADDALLT